MAHSGHPLHEEMLSLVRSAFEGGHLVAGYGQERVTPELLRPPIFGRNRVLPKWPWLSETGREEPVALSGRSRAAHRC